MVALPLIGNGLILIAWLISALGFGLLVLRPMQLQCAVSLRLVLATALGLGIISLLTLMLGCVGLLHHWSALGIIIVGWAGVMIHLRTRSALLRDQWKRLKAPAHFHWLWLALVPLSSIALICGVLPPGLLWGDEPNGYDVTEYHLQVPREWYEAGKIVPLHHNVFSYFPFNVEMHYLLAMHLRSGPWNGMYLAQLMHASFIVLSVLAIYALLAEKHPRGAIIAAIITGATPWLTLLAPVAYNEGGLLLFGTLAIGLAMRVLDVGCVSAHHRAGTTSVLKHTLRGEPIRWMARRAMAGFACGSKLTAVPEVLIPVPILVALIGKWKNKHRTSNIEHPMSNESIQPSMFDVGCSMFIPVLAFWLSAMVTFSPWLIRNMLWTHNPVFPEATSIFGKVHWTDAQVERWQRANHMPRADQQNLVSRAQAGWDQILGDARFGYVLVPLGVVALLIRRDRESLCLGASFYSMRFSGSFSLIFRVGSLFYRFRSSHF